MILRPYQNGTVIRSSGSRSGGRLGAGRTVTNDDERMLELERTNEELLKALSQCREHLNLLEEKIRQSAAANDLSKPAHVQHGEIQSDPPSGRSMRLLVSR